MIALFTLGLGFFAGATVAQRAQTFAPHETDKTDGPAPIVWPTPDLRDRSRDFESAEERGERFPRWQRNVFVAGLREGGVPRTGQIQRIVFNDQWQEVRREPMLMDLQQRIRDVRQGPGGLLYVLTAEQDGALLRIEPRASR